jgi:hypothetical protein
MSGTAQDTCTIEMDRFAPRPQQNPFKGYATAVLKARLAQIEAALAEVQEANRRLDDILRTSKREKFGKRSEKLSPNQFNLPLVTPA